MSKFRILDLFSGIGGFSLGLERTGGFETAAFCEIAEFQRAVLKKHWPDVPCFNDVTMLRGQDVEKIDIITGGFPCQDLSVAGRQAGIGSGTRSGLWSEIARLADEIRPKYILVENVAALLSGPTEWRGRWFGRVLGDLAEIGYDAEWYSIPASYLGAWHRRERIWILAYPKRECRRQGQPKEPIFWKRYDEVKPQGVFAEWPGRSNLPKPNICRGGNGVSKRLDGLGNAVIPQIPEMFGRAILDYEASS